MDRDELAGWLRLTLTRGVGNDAGRRLMAAFGLPSTIFQQSPAALRQVVSEAQTRALLTLPDALAALLEATWTWLYEPDTRGHARRVMTLADTDYPATLLQTEDPPLLLHLLGAPIYVGETPHAAKNTASAAPKDAANFGTCCLAIVGSRNPTPQGADNALQFSRAFSAAGLTVVSGLALGIDGAAHEGAIQGALLRGDRLGTAALPATIAVVGTGLDRVYPRRHLELAHRIASCGLLVSEYLLGTPPLAPNFPKRNRIISGLSQGTLVVEAALASGSLITSRMALEQGRDVFAIPGSIHSPQSRGCHALIRQGAKLVESAQDVLEELTCPATARTGLQETVISSVATQSSDGDANGLFESEPALLRAMGFDVVGLDALVARTGMDAATLQVALLSLEMDGQIARLPGGMFQRRGRT